LGNQETLESRNFGIKKLWNQETLESRNLGSLKIRKLGVKKLAERKW
jgi:hypothetical protein